jgi:hypothetical protein
LSEISFGQNLAQALEQEAATLFERHGMKLEPVPLAAHPAPGINHSSSGKHRATRQFNSARRQFPLHRQDDFSSIDKGIILPTYFCDFQVSEKTVNRQPADEIDRSEELDE